MPDKRGRFLLYSDTSKHATGSALHQVQNGKPKLIAHASKRMPKAARNYSITELEMCSLAVNIASFAHLLKRGDIKTLTSRIAQQPPRSIVLPPGSVLPPIVVPPNDRPPPNPPIIDESNTDPHQGPDPSMDIEENSPH